MECASLPPHALPGQSDERLVELTRAGDPRAFEEIVRRYRPALVRYAGGFLLDGRAEDVVQEALLRSHRSLLANGNEIQLRSWLYRIVHNGAISELRATRPHEQLHEGIDGVAQPPELIERREQVRGVVARLKALPASQRQALVASELEGSSHDQIAASLGTTAGGVSQLIFRARTSLRSGAASLLPMPLMRWLSTLSGQSAAAGAAGSGGAAAGGIGVLAGSSGAKLGATVAAAVLAVGSGAALERETNSEPQPKQQDSARTAAAVVSSAAEPAVAGAARAVAAAESASGEGHNPAAGSGASGSTVVRTSGSADTAPTTGAGADTQNQPSDPFRPSGGGDHRGTDAPSGPSSPSGPSGSEPRQSGPSGDAYRPPPEGTSPTSHYSSQGPSHDGPEPESGYLEPLSEPQMPPPDGGDGFSGPGGDGPTY